MSDTTSPVPPPVDLTEAPPAQDMSQYIRTYAKDVAQLSGKGNVGAIQKKKSAPAPEPKVAPVKKVKGEVSDGVEFDATEQPFFEAQQKPERPDREVVDLESSAELNQYVEGTPAPEKDDAKEKRDEVLARLRAKMTVPGAAVPVPDVIQAAPVEAPPPPKVVEQPVQAPTPQFVEPKPEPVHAMPPLYREPIEEPPAPVLPPPPIAPRPQPVKPQAAAPFHSFSTDFKDHSAATQSSSFSVLAAGLDAGQAVASRPEAPHTERPPVLVLIAGIVLLVLGVGGAYAAYLYVGARHEVPVITLSVPSLIFADEYKKVDGTGAALLQALATTASEQLAPGSAVVTYIGQPATGETGTLTGSPAPGGVLIKALALSAPDLLLRNIEENSTVGIINEGGDTRTFFILRVSSYERTFAAMLTWEPLMMREIGTLYPMYPEDTLEPSVDLSLVATTTATSTLATASTSVPVIPSTPPPVTVSGRFVDAIVANRDVRILRDSRGRSIMLYGYADRETLIIARNEAAFAALLVRLSAGGK
jgi:hypothetical protein